MATIKNATVSFAAQSILDKVGAIIANLRARPDAGAQKNAIETLLSFQQSLANFLSASSPTGNQVQILIGTARDAITPLFSELTAFNDSILKMGQLNTDRIITPQTATSHNAALTAAEEALQYFVASLTNALSLDADGPNDNAFDPPPDERDALFAEWVNSLE